MHRTSPHTPPPPRSTIDTMPGQPAAQPAAQPPPARRWSWSLEPDALIDAGGDEWWASLRPFPLDPHASAAGQDETAAPAPATATPARREEPQLAPVADDGERAPNSSAPPPPMVTEVYEQPAPPRRWLMPALVMGAALAVVLGSGVSEHMADGSGQAAALQQAADAPPIAPLPTLDARVELTRVSALARLQVERAGRNSQPRPSKLVVSSARPCAQIWLDARNRGSGQGRTFVVSPGAHAVACRLASGRMLVRRAEVAEGQTASLFFGR